MTPGMMMGGGSASSAGTINVDSVNVPGPTGPGWVVELKGYHYYHDPNNSRVGAKHVQATLINNLENGFIQLPTPNGPMMFSMDELGVGYVISVYDVKPQEIRLLNPNAAPVEGKAANIAGGFGAVPMPGVGGAKKEAVKEDPENPSFYTVHKYDFVVQFVWQEKPLNVRLEEKAKKLAAAAAAPAAQGQTPPAPAVPSPAPQATGVPPGAPVAPTAPVTPGAPAPATPGAPAPVTPGPAAAPMPPATTAPAVPGAPPAPMPMPPAATAPGAPPAASGPAPAVKG
jgi:type IV pilus assembly protein PilM